jgi:putative flippase GtrA
VTVEPVVARRGLVDGGARFVVTGLAVLPLSLGLYPGSVRVGVDPHVARVLSYVVGIALAAVLHRRWTFVPPACGGRSGGPPCSTPRPSPSC